MIKYKININYSSAVHKINGAIFSKINEIKVLKKSFSIIFILFFIFFIIPKYANNKLEIIRRIEPDTIKYNLVVPVILNDLEDLFQKKEYFEKYINFENLVIIAPDIIKVPDDKKNISIIKEDKLVPKSGLINIFTKRGITESKRLGWYEQQFLKMSYSRVCDNEYYLLWDSDTFPVKSVQMFENGHPIFDMKTEHHSAYFTTINRLIKNLHFSKFSYISEHMLIKTEYMRNLLDDIEHNSNIYGNMFWEKIIMSIDKSDINKSGFSEFELYGSYVDTKYPNFYKHRHWNSRRDMTIFYGNINNLDKYDFNWISKDFEAITFEKRYEFDEKAYKYSKNLGIHNSIKAKFFFKFYKRIIKKYIINLL